MTGNSPLTRRSMARPPKTTWRHSRFRRTMSSLASARAISLATAVKPLRPYPSAGSIPLRRSRLSGFKHDLAPGVTLLEFSIGIANFGQGIDLSNRDLEAAGGEHASELSEHLGVRPCVVTVGLDTVLGGGGEVDDGVDPI